MDPVVLILDCGTQSLRTLLFGSEGSLLTKIKLEYEPYESPRPGWAEKHPDIYWNTFIQSCVQLKQNSPDLFKRIQGIGITTQRDSMVCLDESGKSLRPAVLWLDQRKANIIYRPKGVYKLAYLE